MCRSFLELSSVHLLQEIFAYVLIKFADSDIRNFCIIRYDVCGFVKNLF